MCWTATRKWVSLNSSRAITLIFGLIPLRKVWATHIPHLWVKKYHCCPTRMGLSSTKVDLPLNKETKPDNLHYFWCCCHFITNKIFHFVSWLWPTFKDLRLQVSPEKVIRDMTWVSQLLNWLVKSIIDR